VVGAFYFDAKAGWNNFLLQAYKLGLNITVHNFQTTESTAGFGQATYEYLPDTNLTVGARYTSETKDAVDGSTTLGVAGPGGGPEIASVHSPDAELHSTKATYRVSLDHRFTDQFMAYVSYNTGFKSGGFNTGAPGTKPYMPETLDAAELGIKSDFFDKRVRIDFSAYHYRYSNIQVQQLTRGAIATINGAGAKLYGVDGDITIAVTNNVRITSGLGWNHPDFTSFPNCPFVPPQGGVPFHPGNCAGNRIPLASDFVGNIGIDYTVPLHAGSLDLNANAYYNSGFYFTPDNNTGQGAYSQVSASGTWTAPDGHLSVGAWGKNLTDKRVVTYNGVNTANGTSDVYYLAPRLYGLTIGYKF
jgi:iron complex outermembrane receptor protein